MDVVRLVWLWLLRSRWMEARKQQTLVTASSGCWRVNKSNPYQFSSSSLYHYSVDAKIWAIKPFPLLRVISAGDYDLSPPKKSVRPTIHWNLDERGQMRRPRKRQIRDPAQQKGGGQKIALRARGGHLIGLSKDSLGKTSLLRELDCLFDVTCPVF